MDKCGISSITMNIYTISKLFFQRGHGSHTAWCYEHLGQKIMTELKWGRFNVRVFIVISSILEDAYEEKDNVI